MLLHYHIWDNTITYICFFMAASKNCFASDLRNFPDKISTFF